MARAIAESLRLVGDLGAGGSEWISPGDLGLYCEAQQNMQCGAHALHAILGRRVAATPTYLFPDLAASTGRWRPAPAWERGMGAAYRPFSPDGLYSVSAINHWLYEHTTPTNTAYFRHVLTRTAEHTALDDECERHTWQGSETLTKSHVLAVAPPGAGALLVLYQLRAGGTHYKAWVRSGEDWYECESIKFAATGRVKRMRDVDWEVPQPPPGRQTEVYCLVQGDAYAAGRTLSGAAPEGERTDAQPISSSLWQDGRSLAVESRPVRWAPQPVRAVPDADVQVTRVVPARLGEGVERMQIDGSESGEDAEPMDVSYTGPLPSGPAMGEGAEKSGEAGATRAASCSPRSKGGQGAGRRRPRTGRRLPPQALPCKRTARRRARDEAAQRGQRAIGDFLTQQTPTAPREEGPGPRDPPPARQVDGSARDRQHDRPRARQRLPGGQASITSFLAKAADHRPQGGPGPAQAATPLPDPGQGPAAPQPAGAPMPRAGDSTSQQPCQGPDQRGREWQQAAQAAVAAAGQERPAGRQPAMTGGRRQRQTPSGHGYTGDFLAKASQGTSEHPASATDPGQVPAPLPAAPPAGPPPSPPTERAGEPEGIEPALLRGVLMNVRGVCSHAEDVYAELSETGVGPLFLVLTETKLVRRRHVRPQCLQPLAKRYHLYHSAVGAELGPRAGVCVAVNRELTELGSVGERCLEPDVQGYLVHVAITLPGSAPLHVLGAYIPPPSEPGHLAIRQRVNQVCQERLAGLPAGEHVLVAGDFNAAAQPQDRQTAERGGLPAQDRLHQRGLLEAAGLRPIDAGGVPRPRSYFRGLEAEPCSRIDDFLIRGAPPEGAELAVEHRGGTGLDHAVLRLAVPFTGLGLRPPPLRAPPAERVYGTRGPRTADERAAVRRAIEQEQGVEWGQLAAELAGLVETEVRPHWRALQEERRSAAERHQLTAVGGRSARAVVDEMGQRFTDLLAGALEATQRVCPTPPSKVTGEHYWPRVVSRRRARLVAARRDISQAVARAQSAPGTGIPGLSSEVARQAVAECQEGDPGASERAALKQGYGRVGAQLREVDRQHRRLVHQRETADFQRLMDEKQRLGNFLATGQGKQKPAPRSALRVLRAANGRVTTDPASLTRLARDYFGRKMAAPPGEGPAGAYLPGQATRAYPWGREAMLGHVAEREWLHDAIDDEQAFHECIKGLSRDKAPGPDGVPNEVLQALPEAGLAALHDLLRLMWATGLTPSSWKESKTVLLYKHKGTPLELKSYRRIGLENTVYKVWTRMVTAALTDRAERAGVLSSSQAGFRNKRSTREPIEMMVMALEDAHATRQDIYLLQADMTEAFDTISHTRLLQIIYDLGFPTDAVEAVRDLYSGATTRIQLPHALTEPMGIGRGTIQGDSLSPFLFLLYMEPLLRWLRQGGHGYQFGCLRGQGEAVRARHQLSDIAFADDVNILAGRLGSLKEQAGKLSSYASWGHLVVNATKTTVTGALHGTQPAAPYDEELLRTQLSTVRVQGQAVTFHPPREPFRHLGVILTMDLNFRHQLAATLSSVREQVARLGGSLASAAQRRRVLETKLRPSIAYAFCAAPYTRAELAALDRLLLRGTRRAYGLAQSAANALVHERTALGGLGCHSLEVEYAQVGCQRLVRALNNEGSLGVVTRALLSYQCAGMDELAAELVPHALRWSMRVRQLMEARRSGLSVLKEGATVGGMAAASKLAASVLEAGGSAGGAGSPDAKLVEDLHALHQAGLQSVQCMLTADGERVLPASELRRLRMRGRRTRGLASAWARVATYLATGRPARQPLPELTARGDRGLMLDPGVRAGLRDAGWGCGRARESAEHALYLLRQASPGRGQEERRARDVVASYHERLLADTKRKRGADIRAEQATATLAAGAGKTGVERFEAAMGHRRGPKLDEVLAVFTHYSHPEDSVIEEVSCVVQATQHAGKGKGRRKVGKPQIQYRVRWRGPTYQPGWLVQAAKTLGYSCEAVEGAGMEDQRSFCEGPCDRCRRLDGALIDCLVCGRAMHDGPCPAHDGGRKAPRREGGGAPGEGADAGEDEESTREAGTCGHCLANGWTRDSLPDELKTCRVTWTDTNETEETVLASGTPEAIAQMQRLKEEWASRQGWAKAAPPPAQAEPVPPPAPEEGVYDVTIGQACRRRLVIHPLPINPHTDIEGTGRHEVALRRVETWESAAEGQGRVGAAARATLHLPDGRTVGTLPPERVAQLYWRYERTRRDHPQLMAKLGAGTFAEELYRLMLRYREGACAPGAQGDRLDERQERALPPGLRAGLLAAMGGGGGGKERLASPLTVLPGTAEYWSKHERDQVFGASHDAYGVQWTGPSIAVPEFTQAAAERALLHALRSARRARAPTLTVLLLPSFGARGSMEGHSANWAKWVARYPRSCRILARLPAGGVPLVTLAHLRGEGEPANAGHLRWDTLVVVVGNEAGHTQLLPVWSEQTSQALPKAVRDHLAAGSLAALGDRGEDERAAPGAGPRGGLPSSFNRLRPDTHRRPGSAGLAALLPPAGGGVQGEGAGADGARPVTAAERRAVELLGAALGEPPKLRHDWRAFIYTDGSALTGAAEAAPGIGAAAVRPSRGPGSEARSLAIDCTFHAEGEQAACVNTINRAELAGIAGALDLAQEGGAATPGGGEIHIATDSLCSIHQIKRMLMRPQDMREHRHCRLIEAVVGKIAQAGATVHLWKVKGHTGVVGNELADQVARAVASGEGDGPWPNAAGHVERKPVDTPSNDRESMHWLYKEKTPPEGVASEARPGAASEAQTGLGLMAPVPNLAEALKKHADERHRLGQANQGTVYASVWRGIRDRLDPALSHAFITSRVVGSRARRLALQYRYGLLPTHKNLHRYKAVDSPACPLCGQLDGGHHAVSACPKLSDSAARRHNRAGAEIAAAIRRGARGGQVVATDVGEGRWREAAGLPAVETARRLPAEMLPTGVPDSVREAICGPGTSVPDVVMRQPGEGGEPDTWTLVEIKYCRDTSPEGQMANAERQHAELAQALRDAGCKVERVALALGVSGAIYREFLMSMRALGVDGREGKALAGRLHRLAVEELERIWGCRRRRVQGQEARGRLARHKHRGMRPYRAPTHRKAAKRKRR